MSNRTVRVKVPASTANLGPGFDCLGMALDLYNIVELTEIDYGLSIEVEGSESSEDIPGDESNIVYRSALEVFNITGFKPAGLKIRLVNNIPVSRGLGSSASAIAGGIKAANILSGNKLDMDRLLDMAAGIEGHADNIAPALLGGITVFTRSEDKINYLRFDPPEGLEAAAAIPDYCVSTKSARSILPERVAREDAVSNIGRTALLVTALYQGAFEYLELAMEDRLHQEYRKSMIPGQDKVFTAALRTGARGAAVSGAGPTLIALCDKNTRKVAEAMVEAFKECGVQAVPAVLRPSAAGAEEI